MTKSNPFLLKAAKRTATLMGGTVGSIEDAKHQPPVFSAAASSTSAENAQISSDAHHALSAMVAGFITGDRELLDAGFEELVEIIEVMRDAVPKIQP